MKIQIMGFWIMFFSMWSSLHAQDSLLLSFEDFLIRVEQNHPIAKQIRLIQVKAQLKMMETRGKQLDPKLEGRWKFKQFDGYNYYNIYDAYLKIPTSWGIDIKAGYNGAEGYYLNPSDQLPDAGQAYLGVNIPLLQGLWNNEQKTTLQLAQLGKKQAPIEIKSALNHLFFNTANHYWKWTAAYNNRLVYAQSLEIAKIQFRQVKATYIQGEIPAIDTLKSFIRIQDLEIKYANSLLKEQEAKWEVENHLWLNDSITASLNDNTTPLHLNTLMIEQMDSMILKEQLDRLEQHPDLQLYQFKLKALELEQRFKKTKLLPKANFSYNLLSANHVNFFEHTGGISSVTENYKLGFKLSYPILIRKERASLQLNKIKQKEVEFKLHFKRQELKNKIRNYFTKTNGYAAQVVLLKKMLQNYQKLVLAEQEKFALGESNIFMINTRQQQFVDAQLKLFKTQIKFLKARTAWTWATASW